MTLIHEHCSSLHLYSHAHSHSDAPGLTFSSGHSSADASTSSTKTTNNNSGDEQPLGFVSACEAEVYQLQEQDAQDQIDEFIASQQRCPTADQWRLRVSLDELIDDPVVWTGPIKKGTSDLKSATERCPLIGFYLIRRPVSQRWTG